MCYWRQWRDVRTKVRNLLKLSVDERQATMTALSRKSYWHLSKSLATQVGMTNEWFERTGLLSLKKLWSETLSGLGPITFMKRLVRTRMLGVVGRAGENPVLTRLFVVCPEWH